ncbi:MAG: MFS transporter, partial [Anaerolineales bacterium]
MSELNNITALEKPLTKWAKIVYGTGDWGRASYNTLRQIFYAIFLTDVVGLDPRLASLAALISIIWDAINDPLVGSLSDNVRTRWGRRRPFLLLFSIPFALAFLLLWWAPPWKTQFMLLVHVTLAFMVSDTIQTLVTVPYLSLTPEIAPGYDERTSLTSFRMFFNLIASLVTAVSAPIIIDTVLKAGYTLQQGYLTIAALFGGLASIPFILIFVFIKERETSLDIPRENLRFRQILVMLWQNAPFRYATGIYVLNWISFDIVALMLPYFLLYWIGQGDLLAKVNILGGISLEAVVLGVMMLVATLTIPFWNRVARRYSKRSAYIMGMVFWVVIQSTVLFIQPGQTSLIILVALLAGISVSNAHIMPEAMFPDVIDWDELKTHARHEGTYYGAINFIRKLSSAIAIFLALQALGWFGYQSPPEDITVYTQPDSALLAIRLLTGPAIILLLSSAILVSIKYPISRERQKRIRNSLLRRKLHDQQ